MGYKYSTVVPNTAGDQKVSAITEERGMSLLLEGCTIYIYSFGTHVMINIMTTFVGYFIKAIISYQITYVI